MELVLRVPESAAPDVDMYICTFAFLQATATITDNISESVIIIEGGMITPRCVTDVEMMAYQGRLGFIKALFRSAQLK